MRRVLLGALTFCVAVSASGQTTAPRMHLVEDLRIAGTKMGFDQRPLAFLLVTPRGRIAYVDPYKFRVNFFDAAGNHIGDYGKRGEGPGEFSSIRAIEGARASLSGGTVGDSIWLADDSFRGNERMTYLSSQGDFLGTLERSDGPRSAAPNGKQGGAGLWVAGAYADGGVLWVETFSTSVCADTGEGRTCSSRTDSVAFVRVPKTSDSERRIARISADPGYVTVSGVTLHAPFSEPSSVAVASDGNRLMIMAWRATSATGGTVVLTAISARGDTLFVRQYPFSGITIDSRHAATLVDQLIRDHDRVNSDGTHEIDLRTVDEFKRKLRAAVPLSRMPVRRVRIGLDNSLWLMVSRGAGGTEWRVLDEKGDPYATVLLGANIGDVAQMTKSNVWAIERAKDNRPSIVRYRVVAGQQ